MTNILDSNVIVIFEYNNLSTAAFMLDHFVVYSVFIVFQCAGICTVIYRVGIYIAFVSVCPRFKSFYSFCRRRRRD